MTIDDLESFATNESWHQYADVLHRDHGQLLVFKSGPTNTLHSGWYLNPVAGFEPSASQYLFKGLDDLELACVLTQCVPITWRSKL